MPTPLEAPAALIIQVADQVVDLLNDGEFSRPFLAKRYRNRRAAIDKATTLLVAVMIEQEREKPATRVSYDNEFDISVAAIQKLPAAGGGKTVDDIEDLVSDELVTLAQEFKNYLRRGGLNELDGADAPVFDKVALHVPFSHEHLEDQRVVLCPLTVTYRLFG